MDREPSNQIAGGCIGFESLEEFGKPLRRYFSLEVSQLQPGSFTGSLSFLCSGAALLYRQNYPRPVHITGEVLGGRFGVGIRLGMGGAIFAGETVDERHLPSAMTGEEIEFTGRGGYRQMVLAVDQARLLRMAEAERVAPRVLRGLSPGRNGMALSVHPRWGACVAETFGKLLGEADAGLIRASPENFEDLIYESILSVVEHSDLPCGRTPAAVVVRRAIDWADSSPGMLPRIHGLAAGLRMSPRTLQKAFFSVTGMGPNAFFRTRLLNRARHVLLRSDPGGTKVCAVATDLGFTELGRFSVRYRELFGESPSQTLLRRPRPIVLVPG